MFADDAEAGFDRLTWRNCPPPTFLAAMFTTVSYADKRGRRRYDLADTIVTLDISEGPHEGRDGQPAMA
jgi:hypothetical protein